MSKLTDKEAVDFMAALMMMVDQFFYSRGPTLSHSYMAAEEYAIKVLLEHGLAKGIGKNLYVLNWDKLKELEDEVQS